MEVNPEAIDPIEVKIQDIPLEAKLSMAEVKEIRTYTKANIKMMAIKAIITRAIKDFIIMDVEIFLKVIAMDNLEVEAMAEAEAIICSHGHGRSNYCGNANYQYHQYYGHDDEYQTDQYGPPCALCGGYNHSPKHCF